jgi:hypothetical protein
LHKTYDWFCLQDIVLANRESGVKTKAVFQEPITDFIKYIKQMFTKALIAGVTGINTPVDGSFTGRLLTISILKQIT